MNVEVREADYADTWQCAGIVEVLNSYASDPVGGGHPLSAEVQTRLVPALRDHPAALVLLAFAGDRPVGVAVCFFGFSTFAARPLLNIHDLAVVPEWRGRGVGRALLTAAEGRALKRGCCKLTLEVRDDNRTARALYERFGFTDFVLEEPTPTRFLCKPLEPSDPFVGTWKLDPSTLNYQFGRPGRRATYTIEPAPGGLLFHLDAEDPDGNPLKFSYGGELDGVDREIPGGGVLVLSRLDARSIESVLKRDGQVVDRWTRVLQPDESAITITQHVVKPDGSKCENVGVYRRVR